MAQGVEIGSLLGSAIRPKAKDGSRRRPVELNEYVCVCMHEVCMYVCVPIMSPKVARETRYAGIAPRHIKLVRYVCT